jgi:hypothetical protein
MSEASQKRFLFNVDSAEREEGKIDWSQVRGMWGMLQCDHVVNF